MKSLRLVLLIGLLGALPAGADTPIESGTVPAHWYEGAADWLWRRRATGRQRQALPA